MQGARDEMLALHREVESKEVALQEAHRAHQEVVAALQQSNCDLAGARQLVAEQGYVIEHQRGVEARLCEHMASLTNELARAGQEITQLFAKVDRILEIESSNRQTVSRVRASVMSGLAQVRCVSAHTCCLSHRCSRALRPRTLAPRLQIAEALAQAAQTQSASLHAMVDSASESLNRTARFEASLSAKLDVMGLARDTTLREAETAIASLAKRGEEALQSVHELGTGYASATISSLHAMAQEAAGRTRGMRDQLQEEQGHLEELIAASRSTAVSVLETAEAMTRMAQDSLAGARTASLDVVEAARAELQEQSQAGQEIKSTFQVGYARHGLTQSIHITWGGN